MQCDVFPPVRRLIDGFYRGVVPRLDVFVLRKYASHSRRDAELTDGFMPWRSGAGSPSSSRTGARGLLVFRPAMRTPSPRLRLLVGDRALAERLGAEGTSLRPLRAHPGAFPR